MKKILLGAAIFALSAGAFAHNETLSNSYTASVSGSQNDGVRSSSSGNGFSVSIAGGHTDSTAISGSSVATAPGFSNSTGQGTVTGAIGGVTTSNSVGYAGNLSIGNATGSTYSYNSSSANAGATYDAHNNYVPLSVTQTGSAGASSVSEVGSGSNGLAASASGSGAEFTAVGTVSRFTPFGYTVVGGSLTDQKASDAWSVQGQLGNGTVYQNDSSSGADVSGSYHAAK